MTSKQVIAYRKRATREATVGEVEKYHDREGKEEARIAYAESKREARIEVAKQRGKADAARPSLLRRIGTRAIEGPRQVHPSRRIGARQRRGMTLPTARQAPLDDALGATLGFPSGVQVPASVKRRRREERKWGF